MFILSASQIPLAHAVLLVSANLLERMHAQREWERILVLNHSMSLQQQCIRHLASLVIEKTSHDMTSALQQAANSWIFPGNFHSCAS